ncbi:hypothetical protein Tco_0701630 [Tanacetum coccineum]
MVIWNPGPGPSCLALLCCSRSDNNSACMSLISRLMFLMTRRVSTISVATSDVPGDGSRVHTHDHDGSEAPDMSPDSILSSDPKPLGKHRPPPLLSILSPGVSSYPP